MEALIALAVIVGIPLIWFVANYNRFVKLRNHCTEAWSNIDTELKRRYNLIPNLVNIVKGYASHEKELLEEVTRLRQACVDDKGSPAHQAATENALIQGLKRLLVVVENYPDLKASQNYLQLQHELTNTEDRIQAARRFYNGNVRENNNLLETFPSNIVGGMFGFKQQEFFEVEDASVRVAPQVNL